jgi:hypothetical protein
MKYHGIVTECVAKQYGKSSRYTAFFHHCKQVKGRMVKYFELIEDDSMQPVKVTPRNILEFHKFFTN